MTTFASDRERAFTRIYASHAWGSQSRSGPGSEPDHVKSYMELLTRVIREHNVRSVVDIGCGDWAFSRQIDWQGVDYTGCEIVPELVDTLNAEYGNGNTRFRVLDLVSDELPPADLCICKDVLQHLSNASVQRFLEKLQTTYRLALLTNDVERRFGPVWPSSIRVRLSRANCDTHDGGSRSLRLTHPPFSLSAQDRLEYLDVVRKGPAVKTFLKQVLLWQRPDAE